MITSMIISRDYILLYGYHQITSGTNLKCYFSCHDFAAICIYIFEHFGWLQYRLCVQYRLFCVQYRLYVQYRLWTSWVLHISMLYVLKHHLMEIKSIYIIKLRYFRIFDIQVAIFWGLYLSPLLSFHNKFNNFSNSITMSLIVEFYLSSTLTTFWSLTFSMKQKPKNVLHKTLV